MQGTHDGLVRYGRGAFLFDTLQEGAEHGEVAACLGAVDVEQIVVHGGQRGDLSGVFLREVRIRSERRGARGPGLGPGDDLCRFRRKKSRLRRLGHGQ